MRFDGSLVWVRLDRAMATFDWILKFPSIHLHHLQGLSSDHKPLWLASNDVNIGFTDPKNLFSLKPCGSKMIVVRRCFTRPGICA